MHLQIVFDLLKTNQLRVKLEKCQFGREEVQYLGYVISQCRVAVDPLKIEAMISWLKLKTFMALKGFLGLLGYYRKFMQNYGKITTPITNMLKKDSFEWTSALIEAFDKLKLTRIEGRVLSLPDFSKSFIFKCNASDVAICAVLLEERPITYFSQVLDKKHLLLSTY